MTPRRAALASALLVLGCLALANALLQRLSLRLDLSEGRLWSLSAGSKRVLKALPGPMEARVYFTSELPPEYAAARSYLRDLLAEYRSASGRRLAVRFLDVDKDPAAKEEALAEGVAPVQFNVVSQDKYELREGFMGLVLRREDKKEVIPVVLSPGGLEYEITSRVLRLAGRERPRVGVVSSHGALSPEALPQAARRELEERFELVPVELSSSAPDVAALLVLGPTQPFPEPALAALDAHLAAGRPLLAAFDVRRADLRQFVASPNPANLQAWLRRYGLSPGPTYVLDAQNQPVQVTSQRGFFQLTNIVPYPLFPIATDLDRSHPVTRHLESLTLPFAAPVFGSTTTHGGAWHPLARSSARSWLRAAWGRGFAHGISPMDVVRPEDTDARGPFSLAAVLEAPKARILAVGTSAFARGDLPAGSAGAAFLLNAVDWMAQDTDLIAIRSKDVAPRALREIHPAGKALARWACMLLPPFGVAFLGLLRLRLRRRASRKRVELYS